MATSVSSAPVSQPDPSLDIEVRLWRTSEGLTVRQAGEALGIPHRTVERIEQRRSFRYPGLLMLALETLKSRRS